METPAVAALNLRTEFDQFDADKSGWIDAGPETLTLLQESGMSSSPDGGAKKAAEQLLTDLDTDRDGKISFAEFCAPFGGPPLQTPPTQQRRGGPASYGGSVAALQRPSPTGAAAAARPSEQVPGGQEALLQATEIGRLEGKVEALQSQLDRDEQTIRSLQGSPGQQQAAAAVVTSKAGVTAATARSGVPDWMQSVAPLTEGWGCQVGGTCVLGGTVNGVKMADHFETKNLGQATQSFALKTSEGSKLQDEAAFRLSEGKGKCGVLKLMTCCTSTCLTGHMTWEKEATSCDKSKGLKDWTNRCLELKKSVPDCDVDCSLAAPRGAAGKTCWLVLALALGAWLVRGE